MPDPQSSVSAGEVGGIIAGATAVLGMVGGAVAWFLRWVERRTSSRAAKLQQWHDELKADQAEFDAKMAAWEAKLEHRVETQDGQIRALRLAFELVAAPLRTIDPDNPALSKAEKLLEAAFPLDPTVPPDMSAKLGAID